MLWNFVVFCLNHWWIVLISLAYIGSCSLLLSHLIFGPMRRFENVLVQKKENPTEPVRCNLRRADYFHKFSKLLEEVLNGLDAMEGPAQIGQGKGAGAEKPDHWLQINVTRIIHKFSTATTKSSADAVESL
ncbi:hypothetical protein MYX75_05825 [Acidobacteria bacterium AH-259-A15]|nr:hypothetical protein [Acidobacteria bacterium AH-259-A15]